MRERPSRHAAGVPCGAGVTGCGAGVTALWRGDGSRRRCPLVRPVGRDIAIVLGQRLGEHVAALAVGDEIDLVRFRGIERRFQRRTAGITDRRRRQTIDLIGVVGRLRVDFRTQDAAAERPLPHASRHRRSSGRTAAACADASD